MTVLEVVATASIIAIMTVHRLFVAILVGWEITAWAVEVLEVEIVSAVITATMEEEVSSVATMIVHHPEILATIETTLTATTWEVIQEAVVAEWAIAVLFWCIYVECPMIAVKWKFISSSLHSSLSIVKLFSTTMGATQARLMLTLRLSLMHKKQ
jgi:hypothetical protein